MVIWELLAPSWCDPGAEASECTGRTGAAPLLTIRRPDTGSRWGYRAAKRRNRWPDTRTRPRWGLQGDTLLAGPSSHGSIILELRTHTHTHGRAPRTASTTARARPCAWREESFLLRAHPQRCRFCWRRSSPPLGPEGLSAGSSRGGTSRTALSVPATWLHVLPLRLIDCRTVLLPGPRARAHAHRPQRYTHVWRHAVPVSTDGSLSRILQNKSTGRVHAEFGTQRSFLTLLVIEHWERAVFQCESKSGLVIFNRISEYKMTSETITI